MTKIDFISVIQEIAVGVYYCLESVIEDTIIKIRLVTRKE